MNNVLPIKIASYSKHELTLPALVRVGLGCSFRLKLQQPKHGPRYGGTIDFTGRWLVDDAEVSNINRLRKTKALNLCAGHLLDYYVMPFGVKAIA